MKRKIVLMGVAAALTATALIGGSLAYFQADGQEVQQQMNTRTLSISLKDAGSGRCQRRRCCLTTLCRERILRWSTDWW